MAVGGSVIMTVRISEFVEKSKIVNLDKRSRAVFVGDTHGDFEASEIIWKRFGGEVEEGETYLVFLGDYVDRGEYSKQNIDFLLSKKSENPEGVVLLLGNHDAYSKRSLSPADFWQSLPEEGYEYYKDLSLLPWIARADGLVAVHGALPFVSDLNELAGNSEEVFAKENGIGLPVWVSVTWGDLNERVSGAQMEPLTGRPQFGRKLIFEYMQKHGWNILIRAHQPSMQGWSFSNNVLTLFTSQVYVRMGRAQERSVALVDLEGGVEDRADVRVIGLREL